MARGTEITLEELAGEQILFRNFEGRKDKFNEKGNRNFSIALSEEMAELLREGGWKVKMLKPRNDEYEPQPYIQVAVSYRVRAPRIILLTSKGRTPLDEDLANVVDLIDIDAVDVTLSQYIWNVNDETGVKAYLKTMYVKVREDPLDLKYAEYEPAPLELEDIIDVEVIDEMREIEERKAIEG